MVWLKKKESYNFVDISAKLEKGFKMVEIIEKDFKDLIVNIKEDIKKTQYLVIENANKELLELYYRLGKIIDENAKYGNKFIEELSIELKLEFSNMKGLSARNLARMRTFYREYKDTPILPVPLAKLSWTNNYTLIAKLYNAETKSN